MRKSSADFNLKEFLKQNQKRVDTALEFFLPPCTGAFKTIHEAMRYSIFAGGKRLRPILAFASYCIFKPEINDPILPAACALEMIHTYSLIHDDLPCMDNDDFRRGKLTNHKIYGEAIAVLAGDALLTLAFEILSKTKGVSAEVVIVALQELAETSGTVGLIGGQVKDIEAEGKQLSGSELEFIHLHKTAALIKTSIGLGGVLGGGGAKELYLLSQFGKKVGLAFQIVDDILDVEGSSETLGKTAGKDAGQNKATYPSCYGLDRSKKMAEQLKNEAIELLAFFGQKALPLKELALYVIERKN